MKRFRQFDDEDRLTDVDFESIERQTEDAILFGIDGKKVWLPRSQIEVDIDAFMVTLPEWLAIEKELV